MSVVVALVVDALAAYRLTRLVTTDDLTDEPRSAVIRWAYRRAGDHRFTDPVEFVHGDAAAPKLATLVTCPWCAGMWVALGVAVARRVAPRSWRVLAEALAMSAVTGLIASRED